MSIICKPHTFQAPKAVDGKDEKNKVIISEWNACIFLLSYHPKLNNNNKKKTIKKKQTLKIKCHKQIRLQQKGNR